MHIQVSYVNQLATTKILGELHIFQAHSQHKTEVGVQPKKEAYAVLKSLQGFNYHLRGMKCNNNNNNNNNDFYKASYPGSTISKTLYIYKKPGI